MFTSCRSDLSCPIFPDLSRLFPIFPDFSRFFLIYPDYSLFPDFSQFFLFPDFSYFSNFPDFPGKIEDFKKEFRVLHTVQHANIVDFFGVCLEKTFALVSFPDFSPFS